MVNKWNLFKLLYKRVTQEHKMCMSFVSGNMEAKTITVDRFQADYQVIERLALGPDYYLCRTVSGEYRIFEKIPGDLSLYREVDTITIE